MSPRAQGLLCAAGVLLIWAGFTLASRLSAVQESPPGTWPRCATPAPSWPLLGEALGVLGVGGVALVTAGMIAGVAGPARGVR